MNLPEPYPHNLFPLLGLFPDNPAQKNKDWNVKKRQQKKMILPWQKSDRVAAHNRKLFPLVYSCKTRRSYPCFAAKYLPPLPVSTKRHPH
jgi:hypothetical protein